MEAIQNGSEQMVEDMRSPEGSREANMEAIGRITAGVAHDFNNQLTVISGFATVALNQIDADHPAHDSITEVARAADRATHLVKQLMSFARKQKLSPKVLDPNALVTSAIPSLEKLIGSAVPIEVSLGEEVGTIRVDPTHTQELLGNLATNARDAMRQQGTLRITTSMVEVSAAQAEEHLDATPGPHVVISVTDTGSGMDAETLSHIFEPFFTTKGKGRGTGLGLATAYGFVVQSGGHITIDSVVGEGTTFHILFPVTDAPADADAPVEYGAKLDAKEQGTILVAEDEKPVRTLLVRVLKAAGYSVIDAEDGFDAIEKFKKHTGTIDMLMTDIVMPGMNGRTLSRKIQNDQPGIKVIYISGFSGGAVSAEDVAAEGAVFVSKPFSPEALLKTVKEHLATPAT
jgi:two-component system, cell cycle sensor histidine kinase and response regulator CckA